MPGSSSSSAIDNYDQTNENNSMINSQQIGDESLSNLD